MQSSRCCQVCGCRLEPETAGLELFLLRLSRDFRESCAWRLLWLGLLIGWGGSQEGVGLSGQARSPCHLRAELISFLRRDGPVRDQLHLVLLAWIMAGLLLSEMVCFDRWMMRLHFGHCLAVGRPGRGGGCRR